MRAYTVNLSKNITIATSIIMTIIIRVNVLNSYKLYLNGKIQYKIDTCPIIIYYLLSQPQGIMIGHACMMW